MAQKNQNQQVSNTVDLINPQNYQYQYQVRDRIHPNCMGGVLAKGTKSELWSLTGGGRAGRGSWAIVGLC